MGNGLHYAPAGAVSALELIQIAQVVARGEGTEADAARIRRAADDLAASPLTTIEFLDNGIGRIAKERARHFTEENRTIEEDLEHPQGTLAVAAACYALPSNHVERIDAVVANTAPASWPWAAKWWKPGRIYDGGDHGFSMHRADRIRELEKAGALLAAEIDVLLAREAAEADSCTLIPADASDMADALARISERLRCACTLEDILDSIDTLEGTHAIDAAKDRAGGAA